MRNNIHPLFQPAMERQSQFVKYIHDELFKAVTPDKLLNLDTYLVLSEKEFEDVVEKGETTVLTPKELAMYLSDLKKASDELHKGVVQDGGITADDFAKAVKDVSKLQKIQKQVVRNGKTQTMTYYVKPNEAAPVKKQKKQEEQPKGKQSSGDSGELTDDKVNGFFLSAVKRGISEEGLHAVEKHYDKLSHINKIRFEREWKAKTGEDYKSTTNYGEETKEKVNPNHPKYGTKGTSDKDKLKQKKMLDQIAKRKNERESAAKFDPKEADRKAAQDKANGIEPVKRKKKENTENPKTNSKPTLGKVKYDEPEKKIIKEQGKRGDSYDLMKIAKQAGSSIFAGQPENYETDNNSGYEYGNGRKHNHVQMNYQSNDENLKTVLGKKYYDEIKTLLGKMPSSIGLSVKAKSIDNFSPNDKSQPNHEFDGISVNVRVRGGSWSMPVKNGQEVSTAVSDRVKDEILAQAVWDLNYDKSRHKDSVSRKEEPRHIGYGSQSSTNVTEHSSKKIDVSDYIKKYGEDKLKKLLNESYTWQKSNWSIKDGHIITSSSSTTKYD